LGQFAPLLVIDNDRQTVQQLCAKQYVAWKTWPVRKENEVALQRAEMRMVRWTCDIKVKDRVPSGVERETRNRQHNLGTTAKQAATVWACVAKRRQYLPSVPRYCWLDDRR